MNAFADLDAFDVDQPADFARDFQSRLHVQQPVPPVIINPSPFVWRDPSSIPTRKWLYGRRLIRKFVGATAAAAGVGKSTLGLAEDVAMASGRDLLGQKVDAPLRVWSWNGEDPREELERRLAAICLHYDVTPVDIGDRLFRRARRVGAPGRRPPCPRSQRHERRRSRPRRRRESEALLPSR
jgi:hypothetical protein